MCQMAVDDGITHIVATPHANEQFEYKREEFSKFIDIIDQMPVSRHVLERAVALLAATRPKEKDASEYVRRYVAWGAGPRATQHLVTAAKASALLDGRPTPEVSDLHRMAVPVLRHRIIANYNALGEGIESDMIVKHVIGNTPP